MTDEPIETSPITLVLIESRPSFNNMVKFSTILSYFESTKSTFFKTCDSIESILLSSDLTWLTIFVTLHSARKLKKSVSKLKLENDTLKTSDRSRFRLIKYRRVRENWSFCSKINRNKKKLKKGQLSIKLDGFHSNITMKIFKPKTSNLIDN